MQKQYPSGTSLISGIHKFANSRSCQAVRFQDFLQGGLRNKGNSIHRTGNQVINIVETDLVIQEQGNGFFIGTVAGSLARFLVAWVVGAVVWGEYMPDTFFGMTMTTPWFYSALYNGAYMVIDCVLILFVGFLLMKTPAKKYLQPYEA